MPLAYRDVLDQYSRSKAFGDPRDFQGFATDLEKLNPGQGYAQAASHDGWWTRASTALDRNVFEPVASYTTEPLGRAIGGLFGNEEAGAEFGRAIPRTLAETAPLYLLGPEAGVPATIAALAGTGALMGAHTYAETGSAKAALVSGAAGALLPGVGRVAGNIGARLAGGIRLTGDFAPDVAGVGGRGVFDQIVPEAAKDYAGVTAGRFAGSQLGMTAVNTASNLAQQRILNPDQSIDWEKEGVHSVISQIPWTVFDLVHTLRAPKTTAEQIRPLLRSPETKSTTETYVSPPSTPEQHAQLDAVLTQLQNVALSDTATPQEKEAALSAAISASADPKAVIDLKKQTSLPANEPVSIAGFARQHLGDNWKVLVDDVQSAKDLGVEPGQTVWVNGAKPEYDQQSGQHIFKVNSGQISKNVTMPLEHGDFGIVRDPNQPELPVQGKPFEGPLKPDQQRTLEKEGVDSHANLTPEARDLVNAIDKGGAAPAFISKNLERIASENGVEITNQMKPEDVVAAIRAKAHTIQTELAPVADQIEQTHTQLAETKQKIDTVPQSAEEIPKLLTPTQFDWATGTKPEWLTPEISAKSAAVKYPSGKVYEGPFHGDADELAKTKGEEGQPSFGYVTQTGRFVTDEEHAQEVAKAKIAFDLKAGSTPTQAVEKVRLQTNTPEHDAALQQLNVLREQAKVISMTGKAKPQAQYGEAVRDENGQNFPTRALADAYKESDPDLSEHVVRDAGAGKGFYLAKQINKEVSLEGTDLDKVLPAHESVQEALDDPSTPPVTGRPDVSKEDVLRTLDQMAKQPKVADEILDNGGDLAQTLSELKTAREFLSANLRGEKPEVTPELMKTVAKVVKGSGLWNRAYRNFTLASDVPADPELVKKLNLQDGGANAVLDFFTGRQESGLHGEMMTALRKAVDFSSLKFTYNLRDGWTYSKDGTVNVPYMPSTDTLDSWLSSFNHELTHHATRDLAERTDPAAMQFKATLSQGLEALKQSPAMPRQVRRVVGEFLSEFKKINDADAASFSDIQKNLIDKWRTKVGDKLDEWMHVVYGLQNHDELVSSMFESPQMVKLMQQTKMPKNLAQTVLQFFSKAWNSVFGGKPELDNVFGQVLQGFDNYLAGTRIPPRVITIRPDIPAGPGFLYNLANYDPERNILGGKHTLPKSGVVTEDVLKNIGGVGKPLQQTEVDLYRSLVPEAFTEKGVNVPKLVEGLKEKGPVVETKTLGAGTEEDPNRARAQAADLQHQLESRGYNPTLHFDEAIITQRDTNKEVVDPEWFDASNFDPKYHVWLKDLPEQDQELIRQWGIHANTFLGNEPEEGASKWQMIGPKPESEMPGYVEGLVRVPQEEGVKQPAGVTLKPTPQYTGPHFGSEDKNVLAFYRGYEETLPTGEKAFHVIEVQSDWGQTVRKEHPRGGAKLVPDHPLLRVYESLALKAAIAHAKEIGATKVILSDAETAMMTEGHDRAAVRQYTMDRQAPKEVVERIANELYREKYQIDAGLKLTDDGGLEAKNGELAFPAILDEQGRVTNTSQAPQYQFRQELFDRVRDAIGAKETTTGKVSQETGMRLHYDQTLPSAMEKLTGERGERVELGGHKSVTGAVRMEDMGSPVFRDEQGKPKIQITGRSYDISKIPSEMPLVGETSQVASKTMKQSSLYTGRDYLRDSLLSNGVRPEQLASRMDSVERLFKTGDLSSVADAFEKEGQNAMLPTTANVGPVAPEVKTLLADGNPTDVREAVVNLLADQVPAHQELWNRMREDLNVTRDLVDNIKKGLVPGALPDGIEEKLRLAGVRLNGMKRGLERQARDLRVINYTNNFTYDGLETTIASQLVNPDLPNPPDPTGVQDIAHGLMGLADVRKETAQKELRGEDQMGFLTRTFMLTQHVKKLFPAFRPIADDVREHIGRAIERITTLNLAYAYDYNSKSFSKDIARSNSRVAQNETLTRVSSDIKRWANVQEAAGKEWKWTDDGVQQFLGKLNQKDQDAVKLEFDSERARHRVWTEQILPQALTKINQENTAKVIASFETGMLPDTARDLSQHIYDALALMQDPTQSVAGSEMLRQLGDKMQPNTLIAALKHAQGSVADVNKHLEFMRSRPSYVSEQRYDAHHLVMVGPDGQNFRASAKTKEDLMKIQAKQEAKGYTFLDYVPKADANVPAGGVSGDILDSMRELDVQSYNRLLDALKGVDPTIVAQVLPETQRTAQYEASTNAFKPVPNVTRRFVEGREYINMLENQHEFYVRANNWLRHRLTDTTTSLDMLHPDVAGNRTLKQFADQHVQNSLTPDNAFFRKLVEATYFQRLAFSMGNSLLESVQNLTTGMQSVISETGSVSDAFKYWFGAVNELRKTGFTNKWSNPDTQYLMDKAAHLGARGMAHWNDIIDPDRDTVFTVNQEKFGVVRNAADNIRYGARKWATFFQRYNDNIGLLAGFQLAREKGMDLDEAFNYAWDLKERGLYSGGKAQRPVGLWSIKTKPVPQMLSSLNTYTLGWFSQLATDWKIGFGGVAGDFTPTQRQGAKKAFLYGLSAQAVLAGALGLPGVGQGMALLKQATGIDLKGQLRGGLASLFGEDTENGGILTNLAMRGGLAATTPIDPSNRAAVAFPFLGIDPYKGFDLAQLMGAPGSTVSDAVQGLLAAAHGDFVGFQKLLPSVLKPSMGLLQGEGDVRDKRGTLLYNLSPAERFMTAVGLPPARIQQARDTAEAVKNLNDATSQQHQGLVDELARLTRKGQIQDVQKRLVEARTQNPELDLRGLVKAVAGRVEAQTVPYDYRRNLNVAADLRGFGQRMPASEVQRLQLRDQVEASLGVWNKPNFKEDYRAEEQDALMNANPYLSRAGALRQTEGFRQALRRRSELYFPASQ